MDRFQRVLLATFTFYAGVFVSSRDAFAADRLLLCGGPQVREVEVQKQGGSPHFALVWHWRPEESTALPAKFLPKLSTVDDCKPSADGKEIMVSSSAGGVAIISYPQGEALFYASVPNAHSITSLPNGLIVAAASVQAEGNRLMLFDRERSDAPIFSLPLKGAHGVTWDDRRKVLWALGDEELLRLSVKDSNKLLVEKRYAIEHKGGHDLVLAKDGRSLFVTTSSRPLVFDIETESFSIYQLVAGFEDVKSISFHPETGQLAYTKADPRVWWTYTVRFLNPAMDIPLESETYKVRWSAGTR
jgi:WD40 repeat protein